MAFCNNCGSEIDDNAVVCVSCGVSQKQVVDNGGIGYGLLGFCIPLVGLILFFVWKDEKPKTAKALIIGFGINVALVIIGYILFIIMGVSMAEYYY